MKTYPVITSKISGDELKKCKVADVYFKFKESNRVLVIGYVQTPEGIGLENAGVEIIRIDNRTGEENPIGVVFTDNSGKYAVPLETSEYYDYIFNTYSPA